MTNENTQLNAILKMNEQIGDDIDVIGSLAKLGIDSLDKAMNNDDTSGLYDVANLLNVILSKSLDDEKASVDLGCDIEDLFKSNKTNAKHSTNGRVGVLNK
ncbi:hypothetical protein [Fructilactobacillus frigidiflavus]|uniref:hypothetical protein n=1 Tax=Fructilactobacillus frigidiflavus TaxID=3242688 RepID=UPI00375804F6